MAVISRFPGQFMDEHQAWHHAHRSVSRAGEGVEFLLFHRGFIERVLAYLRTRRDVDRGLLAPWPEIPATVKGARRDTQAGLVWWRPEMDAFARRLQSDIGSFGSIDSLGLEMNNQANGYFHGTVHKLIEIAYGDNMDMHMAPASSYFYQLHGYLDRALSRWVETAGPGRLWHTARNAAGAWARLYDGDVTVAAGSGIRDVTRADCAVGGAELHVCAVRPDGSIWHTLRRGDGSWFRFGDVGTQAGRPGVVRDVACAWDGTQLHVVVVTDKSVWHAVRRADGTWSQLGSVGGLAGFAGATSLAAAADPAGCHLLAATPQGGIRHTLRRPDGTWTPWGDVLSQTGPLGYVDRIGAAAANADLHVVAVTSDGGARHAVRLGNGSWTTFGDVAAATGGGRLAPFRNAVCAAAGGAVHVVLTNDRQSLLHTIRRPDGTWFPLGNATAETGSADIPRLGDVAATTMGDDLHLVVLSQAR